MARNQIRSVAELAAALDHVKARIDWSNFSFEVPLKYDQHDGKFVAPGLDEQIRKISVSMTQVTRKLRQNKATWLATASEQALAKALDNSDSVRESLGSFLAQQSDAPVVEEVADEGGADQSKTDLPLDSSSPKVALADEPAMVNNDADGVPEVVPVTEPVDDGSGNESLPDDFPDDDRPTLVDDLTAAPDDEAS